MCRLAARTGPAAPLSSLLYDPPRSLEVLAYDPLEQHSGHVNVDGTGVAWFDGGDHEPLLYRTVQPPWSDANLPTLSRRLRGDVILAAVRSTTPGLPQGPSFVHPFTSGGLAGTHNGWIADFRATVARPLMAELSDRAFAELPGPSDTAVLFGLAADAHRGGASVLEAAEEATARTEKACRSLGVTATLTLVLADATGVAAVNAAAGRPANTLYVATDTDGAHLLASEPLDPALDWVPVTEGGRAHLTPTNLEIHQ
ncbi:class II glutamine amidotransferase [Euzebya rosea]|uniref:class II glutamine amidotransferase n=1 Tax=Euzebya rosea TaxID=2052804 RepID=UPI000D3E6B85|nr:class II glutamine amidotransferase [Euzebya rosea]